MQPITLIAENHITITKKLFNEAIHTAENKSYLKESKLLLLTLAVLYLLVAVVSLTLFFSIFYSIIFANSTISGIAIRVRSMKIKNSFQRFSGISLLIIIAPTSVR